MNVKSLCKNELDEIKSYVLKLKNLNTMIKMVEFFKILEQMKNSGNYSRILKTNRIENYTKNKIVNKGYLDISD